MGLKFFTREISSDCGRAFKTLARHYQPTPRLHPWRQLGRCLRLWIHSLGFKSPHDSTLGGKHPLEDRHTPFIQVDITSYTVCFNSVTVSDFEYAHSSGRQHRDDDGSTRSLSPCCGYRVGRQWIRPISIKITVVTWKANEQEGPYPVELSASSVCPSSSQDNIVWIYYRFNCVAATVFNAKYVGV